MVEDYLGTDAYLDTTTGDIVPLARGDIHSIDGNRLVLQDIWLRLVTPRGSLWCHPSYGIDIYDYLHAEDSRLNRMGLRAAVTEEIIKDPRVVPESIDVQIPEWKERYCVDVEISFEIVGETNRQNFVLGYDLTDISKSVVKGVLV